MPHSLTAGLLTATTFIFATSASPTGWNTQKRTQSSSLAGQMTVYWGSGSNQNGLATFCADNAIDNIPLAFAIGPDSNNWPYINFGNGCWAGTFNSSVSTLAQCPPIANDIPTCQSMGKKILLSIGGASTSPSFYLSSDQQGIDFADKLWAIFGPLQCGWGGPRPFGTAVVDGFDLDIETGDGTGVEAFAKRLRQNMDNDTSKSYLLTAAPQCDVPDMAHYGNTFANVRFDYLWPQFYNTPACSARNGLNSTYGAGGQGGPFSFSGWVDTAHGAPVFIGLPGAPFSTYDSQMYLSPSEVVYLYQKLQEKSEFGGIMVWDATSSLNNPSGNFVDAVDAKLNLTGNDRVSEGPYPSSVCTTSTSSTTSTTTTSSASSTLTTSTWGASTLHNSSRISVAPSTTKSRPSTSKPSNIGSTTSTSFSFSQTETCIPSVISKAIIRRGTTISSSTTVSICTPITTTSSTAQSTVPITTLATTSGPVSSTTWTSSLSTTPSTTLSTTLPNSTSTTASSLVSSISISTSSMTSGSSSPPAWSAWSSKTTITTPETDSTWSRWTTVSSSSVDPTWSEWRTPTTQPDANTLTWESWNQDPAATTYLTSTTTLYTDVCPTGYTTISATLIATITIIEGALLPTGWPTGPGGVPFGLFTTTAVCSSGCGPQPTTVAVTIPSPVGTITHTIVRVQPTGSVTGVDTRVQGTITSTIVIETGSAIGTATSGATNKDSTSVTQGVQTIQTTKAAETATALATSSGTSKIGGPKDPIGVFKGAAAAEQVPTMAFSASAFVLWVVGNFFI